MEKEYEYEDDYDYDNQDWFTWKGEKYTMAGLFERKHYVIVEEDRYGNDEVISAELLEVSAKCENVILGNSSGEEIELTQEEVDELLKNEEIRNILTIGQGAVIN